MFFVSTYLAALQAFLLPGLISRVFLKNSALWPTVHKFFGWEAVVAFSVLATIWIAFIVHIVGAPLGSVAWWVIGAEFLVLTALIGVSTRGLSHSVSIRLREVVVFCFAFATAAFVISPDIGSVVYHWDAWASWNRWASAFANGSSLSPSLQYPKGLPALASFTYALAGSPEFTAFSKFTSVLFVFLTFAISISINRISNIIAAFFYIASVGILYASINTSIQGTVGYITSLTADVPVAAMFLLPIVMLLSNVQRYANLNYINTATSMILIGIAVAAAALLKQSAAPLVIFIAICYLLLNNNTIRINIFGSIVVGLTVFILAGSVYIYDAIINISETGEIFYTKLASDAIHNGHSLVDRPIYAYISLSKTFGYKFYLIIFLLFMALFNRKSRVVLFSVIIPSIFIYAFLSSYADRNFIVMIPTIAALGSIGLGSVVSSVSRLKLNAAGNRSIQFKSAALPAAVIAIAVLTVSIDQAVSWQSLKDYHASQMHRLGWKYFNDIGIESAKGLPEGSMYFSNYRVLEFQPAFSDVDFRSIGGTTDSIDSMINSILEMPDGSARVFALWIDRLSPGFRSSVSCILRSGAGRVIKREKRPGKTQFLVFEIDGTKSAQLAACRSSG